MYGSLAVVEAWQRAVNDEDASGLAALSADDIAIVGPRGTAVGQAVLAEWLERAHMQLEAKRWFCSGDGGVVVEATARWRGGIGDGQTVACAYQVLSGRVQRFARFDDLAAALVAAGASLADEVTARGSSL